MTDGDENSRLVDVETNLTLGVGLSHDGLVAHVNLHFGTLTRLLVLAGHTHQDLTIGLLELNRQVADHQSDLAFDTVLYQLQDVNTGRKRLQCYPTLLKTTVALPRFKTGNVKTTIAAAQVEVQPLRANHLHAIGNSYELLGSTPQIRQRLRDCEPRRKMTRECQTELGAHPIEEIISRAVDSVEPAREIAPWIHDGGWLGVGPANVCLFTHITVEVSRFEYP